MPKETVLVVGLGEVGRPLFELLDESGKFIVFGFDTDKSKMQSLRQTTLPNKVDIIHICLPCSNKSKFVDIVTNYIGKFEPKLVIVNSTVPLKTASEYTRNAVIASSRILQFEECTKTQNT